MKLCIRPLLLLLAGLWLSGCGSSSSSQSAFEAPASSGVSSLWVAPDPATLGSRLQAQLDAALTKNDIPGAVVGVWTPAGSWTSATGLADLAAQRRTSLTDSSCWRSITKSFTVTMVMQLAAEQRLSLDDAVIRYVADVPEGGRMTLRELANMTSGLFNYTMDRDVFLPELIANPLKVWTSQEVLEAAFRHPNNFPAGTAYEYSNTNTLVLGQVVEAVTRQPFAQVLQERILTPLDLRSTVYLTTPVVPSPAMLGYSGDEEVVISPTGLGAAGAVAGRLEDLHRWGQALVNGRLLPENLQRQRFLGRPPTNGPEYDLYGLGMGEIQGWWGHTGNGAGYQACVFTEPRTLSTVAIMLNGSNADGDVPAHIFREFLRTLQWND